MTSGCSSLGVTGTVGHTPRQDAHATALAGPRTPPGPPRPGPPPDRRPCDTAHRRRWARRAAKGAARPGPRSRVARAVPGVMPGCPPSPHPRVAGTEPRATRSPPGWAQGDALPHGHPRHVRPLACATGRAERLAEATRLPALRTHRRVALARGLYRPCGRYGLGSSPAHPQTCGLGTGSHPAWPLARAASGPGSRPGPCSRTGRQTGTPHAPARVQPHRARDMMLPCGDSS